MDPIIVKPKKLRLVDKETSASFAPNSLKEAVENVRQIALATNTQKVLKIDPASSQLGENFLAVGEEIEKIENSNAIDFVAHIESWVLPDISQGMPLDSIIGWAQQNGQVIEIVFLEEYFEPIVIDSTGSLETVEGIETVENVDADIDSVAQSLETVTKESIEKDLSVEKNCAVEDQKSLTIDSNPKKIEPNFSDTDQYLENSFTEKEEPLDKEIGVDRSGHNFSRKNVASVREHSSGHSKSKFSIPLIAGFLLVGAGLMFGAGAFIGNTFINSAYKGKNAPDFSSSSAKSISFDRASEKIFFGEQFFAIERSSGIDFYGQNGTLAKQAEKPVSSRVEPQLVEVDGEIFILSLDNNMVRLDSLEESLEVAIPEGFRLVVRGARPFLQANNDIKTFTKNGALIDIYAAEKSVVAVSPLDSGFVWLAAGNKIITTKNSSDTDSVVLESLGSMTRLVAVSPTQIVATWKTSSGNILAIHNPDSGKILAQEKLSEAIDVLSLSYKTTPGSDIAVFGDNTIISENNICQIPAIEPIFIANNLITKDQVVDSSCKSRALTGQVFDIYMSKIRFENNQIVIESKQK